MGASRAVRRRQGAERIRAVCAEAAGRYGSPRMAAVLRREGACAIAQTVAQLMRQAGLRARMARRYQANTNSPRDWPVPHHVLGRQFRSARPHAVWMAGITYMPPDEDGLYLASLGDLATQQDGPTAELHGPGPCSGAPSSAGRHAPSFRAG
ncbi:MAG: IS3 family transposase [Thermaerobacter sp.]|nr:IS3 family transposase [Thermaerobacter sp.]